MQRSDYIRNEIQTRLRLLCRRIFTEPFGLGWRDDSENLLKDFDELFENCTPEELEVIMGGEFAFANSMDENKTKIPMYLYMELLAGILETKYGNDPKYGNVDALVARFRELREKTAGFPHDESFDPDKHLASGLIGAIIRSDGFIRLGITCVGDREVLSIECTETRERVRQRADGEYVPISSSTHKHAYPCLYEEDVALYEEVKAKEDAETREQFTSVTGAYFEGGRIPFNKDEFFDSLVDQNVNPDILLTLRRISEKRSEYPGGSEGELAWMRDSKRLLERIKNLEEEEKERKDQESREIVETEERKTETHDQKPVQGTSVDEERKAAIKAARRRYNSQNPLLRWCREITGKQQRFDGIEFDDLSVDEINGLFSDSKKGKK